MEALVGGSIVGAIECAVCQPFDMIKTRHQLHRGANPSVGASLMALYREGGTGRFYRGVLPEFAGMVPKSAAMYATYDWARQRLSMHTSLHHTTICFMAGALSGPAEAVVVQPFQVVKVRMQTKEYVGRYSSSLDCATKMVRTEGLVAFASAGAMATVLRNTIWNSVYFGSMAKVRAVRAESGGGASSLAAKLADLACGFGCGVLATAFNAPFDVAKSRQQSQLSPASRLAGGATGAAGAAEAAPYSGGVLATLVRIAREEGMGACWAGFQPKAIRMGLAGLVGLPAFDLTRWLLAGARQVE